VRSGFNPDEVILMPAVLINRIEKTHDICGGDARIADSRIPVWLLVGYRLDGVSDERLLELYPTLTFKDLSAAWWYYAQNGLEIDAALQSQEDA